ncbi:hypothetical protein BEN49_15105 [Hymenobacter coccineus]|uniref:Uncharacterized protein n=1 Tax=Hymenobacter coccineus TaxID=1908235 RepID=A0A1G1SSP4_9BACT|nr:hypothetical protein BEN49_15105 [Hymenobacter coccineus]
MVNGAQGYFDAQFRRVDVTPKHPEGRHIIGDGCRTLHKVGGFEGEQVLGKVMVGETQFTQGF